MSDTKLALKNYPCVLTIAGSDSSGGAGVQADIKTISATGSYAASVLTVLTAQNTLGVSSIQEISASFVGEQMESVFADLDISTIKIGMLYKSEVIATVAAKLKKFNVKNIVLDPVFLAKSGHKLITDAALETLKERLLSLANLITPNLPEAETLLQRTIKSQQHMELAARELSETYGADVLVKGGHTENNECNDVLFCNNTKKTHWFLTQRIISKNTHGTGCTFSAAIASYLAQGNNIIEAIEKAKKYLTSAIKSGSNFCIGHGCGPVDHNFYLRKIRNNDEA